MPSHADRVDHVLGLSRKQLISEVLRLDGEVKYLERALDSELQNLVSLEADLSSLITNNERRLDELLNKSQAIVDQKLGLVPQPARTTEAPQPIKRRETWREVANRFEAVKKEEFWKKKIDVLEKEVKAGQAQAAQAGAPIGGNAQQEPVSEEAQDVAELG